MFSADLGVTPSSANYIEDVFSTYLYTGNGSTQTITNGIDMLGKGGMLWLKDRGAASNHFVYDSARSFLPYWNQQLQTNQTLAQANVGAAVTVLNNGVTLTTASGANSSTNTYVSWTFRKQAKFFDIVTYTGDGAPSQLISHNLGSAPGCVIIKRTDSTSDWGVWHRLGTGSSDGAFKLNTTAAVLTPVAFTSSSTSIRVYLGTTNFTMDPNINGATYVAYLFAHNAGGFGATGTDNVISCGSYTGNGSVTGPTITLGYEPQWVLIKQATNAGTRWTITDNMRGFPVSSSGQRILQPNLTDAEIGVMYIQPTSTGFKVVDTDADVNTNGSSYIYIAIRRGPMKTPTTGTSVFSAKLYSATTTSATVTHDVTFDAEINANRTVAIEKFLFVDSLRGINGQVLVSANSNIEASFPTYWSRQSQRTMYAPSAFDGWWASASGTNNHVSYGLVRAPGFFDIVCYTGDGTGARTLTHNLGVTPELWINRCRSNSGSWFVGGGALGSATADRLALESTAAKATSAGTWQTPTATTYGFGSSIPGEFNTSARTYVTYLFATVAGVSKVGSYTGTGTTNQINCGFTGGARFVMIKRTDSTGDWYVWDTARGIIAGNDPYLLLNSLAAEVTGTDYVDTYSLGFEISSTAPAAINANGGSFIFLAIA
jgi:hypothetical protein